MPPQCLPPLLSSSYASGFCHNHSTLVPLFKVTVTHIGKANGCVSILISLHLSITFHPVGHSSFLEFLSLLGFAASPCPGFPLSSLTASPSLFLLFSPSFFVMFARTWPRSPLLFSSLFKLHHSLLSLKHLCVVTPEGVSLAQGSGF